MNTAINLLSGKKTYITGLLMVALGALQNDQNLVLQGLGLIFLRQGISKVE